MLPLKEILKGVAGTIVRCTELSCQRNYAKNYKQVVPLAVQKLKKRNSKREDYEEEKEMKYKVRNEVWQEMRITGDPMEPAIEQLDNAVNTYAEDYARLDAKMRRDKVFRKQFRAYEEKELSLLTWAEKEKIRYLHNSSPEEWNAEALASAFPISPAGVEKLLKSTFRARSVKEIESHDSNVVDRIKRIQSGEISLTAELEERMKMREQMPLNVGALGPSDAKLMVQSSVPKIIGEFERLVTPAAKLRANATSNSTFGSSTLVATIAQVKEPEIGDSYMLKDNNSDLELENLGISSKNLMTLQQFESRIKNSTFTNNISQSTQREVEYLKHRNKMEVEPTSMFEADMSDDAVKKPDYEDYLNYQTIPKYKPAIQRKLEMEIEVANDESCITRSASVNNRESFTNKDPEVDFDRIEIPYEHKKSGSLFKRGQSYYDETGAFLYRVV